MLSYRQEPNLPVFVLWALIKCTVYGPSKYIW